MPHRFIHIRVFGDIGSAILTAIQGIRLLFGVLEYKADNYHHQVDYHQEYIFEVFLIFAFSLCSYQY